MNKLFALFSMCTFLFLGACDNDIDESKIVEFKNYTNISPYLLYDRNTEGYEFL